MKKIQQVIQYKKKILFLVVKKEQKTTTNLHVSHRYIPMCFLTKGIPALRHLKCLWCEGRRPVPSQKTTAAGHKQGCFKFEIVNACSVELVLGKRVRVTQVGLSKQTEGPQYVLRVDHALFIFASVRHSK